MGDYKGFGIAMIVEILCGLLSGMPAGDSVSDMFNDPLSQKRLLGQFYSALRVDVFEEPDRFKARLQDMVERIRRQPQRERAVPVQVPGDPEKAFRADRQANGIPIPEKDLLELDGVATELGLTPLSAARGAGGRSGTALSPSARLARSCSNAASPLPRGQTSSDADSGSASRTCRRQGRRRHRA
jgi:hypothetical protein